MEYFRSHISRGSASCKLFIVVCAISSKTKIYKNTVPLGKRSVNWKPRTRKMQWPTAEHQPDFMENPKWEQAITKWQNIAEEAGPEHSELARPISKHKLSGSEVDQRFQQAAHDDMEQNEEVTDLLEDTFAGKVLAP